MTLELYLIGIVLSFAVFLFDMCKLYKGLRIDVAVVASAVAGIVWPFVIITWIMCYVASRRF